MDKIIEALRIIDSPFKLAAVVVLALLDPKKPDHCVPVLFQCEIGYLGYHLRDDIGAAIRRVS